MVITPLFTIRVPRVPLFTNAYRFRSVAPKNLVATSSVSSTFDFATGPIMTVVYRTSGAGDDDATIVPVYGLFYAKGVPGGGTRFV